MLSSLYLTTFVRTIASRRPDTTRVFSSFVEKTGVWPHCAPSRYRGMLSLAVSSVSGNVVCNNTALPNNNATFISNETCVNWNYYYTECKGQGNNPFQGTISFDNIGLAWVAIFLVSVVLLLPVAFADRTFRASQIFGWFPQVFQAFCQKSVFRLVERATLLPVFFSPFLL